MSILHRIRTPPGRIMPPPLDARPVLREPPQEDVVPVTYRHCRSCDVKWHGGPECWCCGQSVSAI